MIRFTSHVQPASARIRLGQPIATQRPSANTPSAQTQAPVDNFALIFSGKAYPMPAATEPPAAPTAQSVFGANPWVATAPVAVAGGGSSQLNPVYFASDETAQKLAQMLGGTVVKRNDLVDASGAFSQSCQNNMIQLSNGRMINAGLVASFYTHGYPQSYIDRLIANEVNPGASA